MKDLRLEIGSGDNPKDGYLHTDIRSGLKGIQVICRGDQLPFKAGIFAEVFATGVFEHFGLPEARMALREWWRALCPRGVIDINVPDIYQWAKYLVEAIESAGGRSREGRYDINRCLHSIFGWQGHEEDLHKWGWTEEHLLYEIGQAGFQDIEIYQRWAYSGETDAHLCVRAQTAS